MTTPFAALSKSEIQQNFLKRGASPVPFAPTPAGRPQLPGVGIGGGMGVPATPKSTTAGKSTGTGPSAGVISPPLFNQLAPKPGGTPPSMAADLTRSFGFPNKGTVTPPTMAEDLTRSFGFPNKGTVTPPTALPATSTTAKPDPTPKPWAYDPPATPTAPAAGYSDLERAQRTGTRLGEGNEARAREEQEQLRRAGRTGRLGENDEGGARGTPIPAPATPGVIAPVTPAAPAGPAAGYSDLERAQRTGTRLGEGNEARAREEQEQLRLAGRTGRLGENDEGGRRGTGPAPATPTAPATPPVSMLDHLSGGSSPIDPNVGGFNPGPAPNVTPYDAKRDPSVSASDYLMNHGGSSPIDPNAGEVDLGWATDYTPPATPAATPAATPTAQSDWNDQFKKRTGTAYDPNSAMDKHNMGLLQGGTEPLDYQQWKQMKKSGAAVDFADAIEVEVLPPFAQLEKEAVNIPGFAKLLIGGGRKVGDALHRSGTASRVPGKYVLNAPMPGTRRIAASDGLRKYVDRFANSPRAQKAVNIGAGTVAGSGALYGSNRLGHSSGREQGVGEGFDRGTELGIQTALANQPQDPGFLGRLLEVFKGNEQGVTAQSLQNYLDEYREDALNAILKGE